MLFLAIYKFSHQIRCHIQFTNYGKTFRLGHQIDRENVVQKRSVFFSLLLLLLSSKRDSCVLGISSASTSINSYEHFVKTWKCSKAPIRFSSHRLGKQTHIHLHANFARTYTDFKQIEFVHYLYNVCIFRPRKSFCVVAQEYENYLSKWCAKYFLFQWMKFMF